MVPALLACKLALASKMDILPRPCAYGSGQFGDQAWQPRPVHVGYLAVPLLPAPYCLICPLPFASQRLEDVVDDLLGVAEQHHGVVAEEQLVLHARIARTHAALDEQHRLGPVHVQDRHAENRRLRIGLRRRVCDVVGAMGPARLERSTWSAARRVSALQHDSFLSSNLKKVSHGSPALHMAAPWVCCSRRSDGLSG